MSDHEHQIFLRENAIHELQAENERLQRDLQVAEEELAWRNDALIDAQHKPQFSYAYPEQTLEAIEEWAILAPRPPYCIHSFSSRHEPGCESCDWHAGYLRRKAAMRERYFEIKEIESDE